MDVVASVPRVHLHAYPRTYMCTRVHTCTRARANASARCTSAHTRTHGEHSPARWYKSRVIAILPCQTAAACRIRPEESPRNVAHTEGTLVLRSAVRVQCIPRYDYGIPRDGRTGRPLELVSGNHPDNYARGKNCQRERER